MGSTMYMPAQAAKSAKEIEITRAVRMQAHLSQVIYILGQKYVPYRDSRFYDDFQSRTGIGLAFSPVSEPGVTREMNTSGSFSKATGSGLSVNSAVGFPEPG